ncbi:hemerythrin domain-containing protein [Streptomyces sp. B1I3]|uniref:hemerythrin domain-containing protein n=1 Tax=Streptomyces sp. B1I3 TaxID=3042264 RepID=UPI00278A9490|nr:hemerythrin domain-containing protein [Streptomyces sp. B1I3]MDQ0797940.1 hemerythrin superfamily protein [Streptomyces sp. B1I3]
MAAEESGTISISDQSVRQLGGGGSVLVRQRRDHAELDRLMKLHESGEGAPDQRQRRLEAIVRLTFSHAFAEEVVLWPVLRRLSPDGHELTSRVEKEHQEINDLIAEMERMGPGDPKHEETVRRAFSLIRQDVRDEEDLLLPRLQQSLTIRRLRRLGAAWESVRRTAPTHPHPAVPRRPPGNAVLGVPLSAFDRARDLMPGDTRAPQARKAAALGAVLAGACLLIIWIRRMA